MTGAEKKNNFTHHTTVYLEKPPSFFCRGKGFQGFALTDEL